MKLVEIANQQTPDFNRPEWKEVVETANLLLRDCRPYLEKIDYKVDDIILYRGINNETYIDMDIRTARLTARKPRDIPQFIHDGINKAFNTNFNHPYRNAVFATGSSDEAGIYGNLHNIFPIGDFEFLWSPKIADIYRDTGLEEIIDYHKAEINEFGNELITKIENNEYEHTTNDLLAAIYSNHEIMLWTKKYYVQSSNQINSRGIQEYIDWKRNNETF